MNALSFEKCRPCFIVRLALAICCTLLLLSVVIREAAAYTITPQTWNTVGLDSNDVNAGPNLFPVGAKVCGGAIGTSVDVYFAWLSSNSNINLRLGSKGYGGTPLSITFLPGNGGCADAFFEAEITRSAAVYDTSREYKIYIGSDSTPTPRALYAERLISQARNGITDVKVDNVSIPAGGSMNLVVGNTYKIDLIGGTATQGYNQFSSFFTLSNTIFQILSVSSVYSADNSPYVPDPVFGTGLYADACKWDNDPNSLTYRSCIGGDYKAGGSPVTTTYQIKIISGGGTSITLSSLLYDFSGSSFHYNGDYSTTARIANIIDPASVNISKGFFPNPSNVATGSALTFTISNPNAGAVSGLSFIDDFTTVVVTPVGGTLRVATPLTTTNTCGGTLTDHAGNPLVAGSAGIKLSGGTVSANSSCIVEVKVTPSAGSAAGTTYANTSNHLFVNTLDTGKFATATLKVNTTAPPAPPPSSCSNPVELARWEMLTTATGPGTTGPPYTRKAGDVSTATTRIVSASGAQSVANINGRTYAWGGTAPTAGNSWSENPTAPNYTLNNYLEFVLDTSNYGGVGVTFDSGLDASGDWANPESPVYVTSSIDGTTFSLFTPSPMVSKNSWSDGLVATAAATSTDKTTFRFATSGSSKPAGVFALDNITFTGCPRVKPPVMKKLFSKNPILASGFSPLVFTISNPNQSVDLTGVTFTDVFPTSPGAMTLYDTVTTNTCGGTLTNNSGGALAANAPGIKLTGATVTKGSSCTVTVNVKAPNTGSYPNSTTVSDATAGNGNTTSDTLTVNPPHPLISLFKEVATSTSAPAPSSILWNSDIAVKAGDKIYYQFTVQNDGDVPLDNITLTDADLAAVDPGLSLSNCVWKNGDDITITPGNPSAQNFSLAVANNSNNLDFAYCIIGPIFAASGTKTNTATANATYLGTAIEPDTDTAKYNGFAPPTVTKVFGAASIFLSGNTTLTLTLGNPATNPGAITSIQVDDTFPAALTLQNTTFTFTPAACGTVTKISGAASAAGDPNIRFSTASIAANATCQLQVNVTSSTAGVATNNTGAPAATGVVVAGRSAPMPLTGLTANASLTVSPLPSLTLVKSVQTYSDPVNSTSTPRAIPGAIMQYTVQVINSGSGTVDNNMTVITDAIPNHTVICVSNSCSNPPVALTSCSTTPPCGLTLTYGSDVTFSNQAGGGAPYSYTPSPDASGFDANVTGMRINPQGILSAASGGDNASLSVTFKVKIK